MVTIDSQRRSPFEHTRSKWVPYSGFPMHRRGTMSVVCTGVGCEDNRTVDGYLMTTGSLKYRGSSLRLCFRFIVCLHKTQRKDLTRTFFISLVLRGLDPLSHKSTVS